MKQLIALAGTIVFLLTFPLQYALEQKNDHNISQFNTIVNAAVQTAKTEGCFTTTNINNMRNAIMAEFDVTSSEVEINVTTIADRKIRKNTFDERELIEYKIGVPIKKIIASSAFWGIADADNQMKYEVEGKATSEYLP